MATLTVQTSTADSPLVPSFVAASAGGDQVKNSGRVVINVANGGASSITVTFTAQKACNQGFTHNASATVAAGATERIGPFDTYRFNDGSGLLNWTYSAVTSVTVAATGI